MKYFLVLKSNSSSFFKLYNRKTYRCEQIPLFEVNSSGILESYLPLFLFRRINVNFRFDLVCVRCIR